jgi:hypothetical protein
VARYRELGGERVVVGSDAHARGSFAHRLGDAYGHLIEAGFDHLTFRRGAERVQIEVPASIRFGTAGILRT